MGIITKIKNWYLEIRKHFDENEMFLKAETKILEILNEKKDDLKEIAFNKLEEKTPKLKEKLGNIIVNNLKLKFPLNLFKKIIKKKILKNYDKLVAFLKEQLK